MAGLIGALMLMLGALGNPDSTPHPSNRRPSDLPPLYSATYASAGPHSRKCVDQLPDRRHVSKWGAMGGSLLILTVYESCFSISSIFAKP